MGRPKKGPRARLVTKIPLALSQELTAYAALIVESQTDVVVWALGAVLHAEPATRAAMLNAERERILLAKDKTAPPPQKEHAHRAYKTG